PIIPLMNLFDVDSAAVRSRPAGRARISDADRLRFDIVANDGATMLTPDPRLLVAAERHARIQHVVGVDPDRTSLDPWHQPMHPPQVVAPDRKSTRLNSSHV